MLSQGYRSGMKTVASNTTRPPSGSRRTMDSMSRPQIATILPNDIPSTTSSEVAYASLTFYGDAIAVYGIASSDNTRVQALVDGDAFPMPDTNTTDLSASHTGVRFGHPGPLHRLLITE